LERPHENHTNPSVSVMPFQASPLQDSLLA